MVGVASMMRLTGRIDMPAPADEKWMLEGKTPPVPFEFHPRFGSAS
jgi:hypothetical protein